MGRIEEKQAERAKIGQFPLLIPKNWTIPLGQRQGRRRHPTRDTSHDLPVHPEGASLLVTTDGDYMDRSLGCCGPAGLRQSRGPLGKFSSCDVLPATAAIFKLTSRSGEMRWKLKIIGGGVRRRRARAGRRAAEAACEAAGGDARLPAEMLGCD
jgi:hypothetical protein